jgi:prephenate dehydrogenase
MVIGMYGLGRFGSFWAGVLAQEFTVKAYSRDASRPCPPSVERVTEDELLSSSDTLILCVSISAMEEVLSRISGRLRKGTLVMDTCSVKVLPAEQMIRILPAETEVIATHPMFGPDSGKNGVRGLPLVFCPVRASSAASAAWMDRFSSIGLSVMEMSPEEHDREAAYTQGVTHFIGRVLGGLNLKGSPMATLGYKKLLEIVEQTCNDPERLFIDLQRHNAYTGAMRRELDASYKRVTAMIEDGEGR